MKKINVILLALVSLFGCDEYDEYEKVSRSLNYSNDANLNVQSINWDTSNFEDSQKYTIKKYTQEEKEEKNILVDAELSFYLDDFEVPLSLTFKFKTNPDQAMLYYYITDCYNVTLERDYGKYTTINFDDYYSCSFKLEAMYDRNINYLIKINALIRYGGGLM